MKKIVPLLVLLLAFSACSRIAKPPALKTEFSQNAVVETGDFSYKAEVSMTDNVVYITATSTNADGLTLSCDSKEVTYSYKGFTDSLPFSQVSDYNVAKILYCVFTDLYNSQVKTDGELTIFNGKVGAGNYILTLDNNDNLISLSVDEASLYINFSND